MTSEKNTSLTTLATAKHGGCVKLKDFPSPGGQGDALHDAVGRIFGCDGSPWRTRDVATVLREYAALAARQPVGEPFGYCADFDPGAHEFSHTFYYLAAGETVPAGCTAFYAAPPAQDVDLPYSLDADPAGIRARVADVITGTLMIGAQGHTPPPAGHWAEPFWQAARHDAALSLNVMLRLRELVAASKYMRDRVVETRGAKCMDDLDYAIDEAEKALKHSQAVGNG